MKKLKHELKCHKYLEKELRKKRSFANKLEVINKALKKHPEDEAELLFETGMAYLFQNNKDLNKHHKTSRQYFKKALALTSDPDFKALIYWRLAGSYFSFLGNKEINNAEKELKYLLLAHKLVPEDELILKELIEGFLKKNDPENTEIYLKRLHKIMPNDIYGLYHLGTLELRRKNLSAAENYYNKLFKKKRFFSFGLDACTNLAVYYRIQKDFNKELFYLEKAYKIYPNTGVCFDLGNYYLRFHKEQKAHRYYYEGVLDYWKFFKRDKDLNEILFSTLEEIQETIKYFMEESKKPSIPAYSSCILYTLFKLNESINKKGESTAWFIQFLKTQNFGVSLVVTDKGSGTLLN